MDASNNLAEKSRIAGAALGAQGEAGGTLAVATAGLQTGFTQRLTISTQEHTLEILSAVLVCHGRCRARLA